MNDSEEHSTHSCCDTSGPPFIYTWALSELDFDHFEHSCMPVYERTCGNRDSRREWMEVDHMHSFIYEVVGGHATCPKISCMVFVQDGVEALKRRTSLETQDYGSGSFAAVSSAPRLTQRYRRIPRSFQFYGPAIPQHLTRSRPCAIFC
jgi:hypothetical protein